jgi:hypothetical protein
MSRPPESWTPVAGQATDVYFDAAVRDVLEREAARLGVTVSEYVHDAALARAAFALRTRAEGPDDLLAGWAQALLDEEAKDLGRRADRQRVIAALARDEHQEVSDEAAGLWAESRQARRHAEELRGEGNVILDAVAVKLTDVLRRQGFALHAPVVARFRTAENGSSGVEVAVGLEDPSRAPAAKAAILERFPDRLSVVVVT